MTHRSILGRSPDADAIYSQYSEYYALLNSDIHQIDQLPFTIWNQLNVQNDRNAILSAQQALTQIYQQDWNSSTATLAIFQSDCDPLLKTVTAKFNDAMNSGSITQKIQLDFTSAQSLASSAAASISQDQGALNHLVELRNTITSLQQQINNLPAGPVRTKAQNDLNKAQADLAVYAAAVASAQPSMNDLQSQLNAITASGGTLDQLSALAGKTDPTQEDLNLANALLAVVQKLQTALTSFEATLLSSVTSSLLNVISDIQTVRIDIQPTPPPPTPGKIEHSCWYIDWTSWDMPVPQGVDTVNLFVGTLMIGPDGNPTIGGFGNVSLAQLDAFVHACANNNPPIAVKASIGGGGGSYDKCWDLLTEDNVDAFAQGLADFCHTHGLTGIDFDYEEYGSPEQEALVGTLIKKFKAIDSNLQATLCTNAGFGSGFPWQAVMKNILDGAVDQTTGKCGVDRLYIMSYYQPLEQEEPWLLGWADWLKQNYGFTPAQVTVGLDDFDAHAYDIAAFSKWAAGQGFSTGYWAWNPATPDASNQSALKILNNYLPPVDISAWDAFVFSLAVLLGPISWLIALISLIFSSEESTSRAQETQEA
ncbi:MAG: hypothetical protein HYX48_00605 [Chlamydiales bacterium]|nr:hypothetical protein [Chlamydiales bacterium]